MHDQQARYSGQAVDPHVLAIGLEAAILTPLGSLVPGRAWPTSGAATASTSWISSSPWPGGTPPAAKCCWRTWPRSWLSTSSRGTPWPGTPALAQRAPTGDEPARLPDREPRPCPPVARGRCPSLFRGRLQDKLARRRNRGPEHLALPAGGPGHRDAPRPLPAAGHLLHGRIAQVPSLAPTRLRPRRPPGRRPVPVRKRYGRAGHAHRRRANLWSVLVAAARGFGDRAVRPPRLYRPEGNQWGPSTSSAPNW